MIEQGKAGPPRESDEPSVHIKQEQLTPVKQQRQIQVHALRQLKQQHFVCKQDAAVLVKTEPEINVVDVNPFDPALTDLAMQVWKVS